MIETAHHLARCAIVLALAACGPSARQSDGGPSDGDHTPDASLFGTACATTAECPGGYCIEGLGDRVCTDDCTVGCPTGWECRLTRVDGELLSVCVPPAFQLCTPCTGDTQCGAGVCVTLGGGGFCLPECPFEGQCPQGYSCDVDPSGTNPGMFCVPMTRECTCTSGASAGSKRTCIKTNALGTCQGLETCEPSAGGWGGCSAADAVIETCDGVDNDCNALVDDGVASGQACTISVAGIGSCPGVTLCAGATGVICQGKTPALEVCNYVDDDCDARLDEGYPNLNTVCSAGVGGCRRFGVIRCTASAMATECSAAAGSPASELCNEIDDNCNGQVDEPFTDIGQACSVGVGACRRDGNRVCATSGAGTTCSVASGMPATEACNSLDDDCDSRVDEEFKDVNGNFTTDRACGSCAVDCTAIYALPNASGICTPGPQCAMQCASGAFDLDDSVANGCEFPLTPTAVYVSIDGAGSADDATCGLGPLGTGAGNHPCRTIAQGIARAVALNRATILVANGVYSEPVTVPNGRNLLGGHRADNWVRDLAATGTVIAGAASIGSHDVTVDASNITLPTVFEGFVIYGSVNSKSGGNSYAIYASGSSSSLAIRSNVILAGRGGPGLGGVVGSDGSDGAPGSGRNTALQTDPAYDSQIVTNACPAGSNRVHANGGVTSCGGDNVSGGNGGGNSCPAADAAGCTGCQCIPGQGCGCAACTFATATPSSGQSGQPGAGASGGAAGAGAARGDDMILRSFQTALLCFIPRNGSGQPLPTYGADAVNGASGSDGTIVGGCSLPTGGVIGGHWIGTTAPNGITGGNGGGGGGGGAGGGAKCDQCMQGRDQYGGHGGGGGAGGCGGTGSGGGSSGGGAFGVFIAGTSAPVLTGNTVIRGEGGVGGGGGDAGRGGVGGSGAPGGKTGDPSLFCSDIAGHGGSGGRGGHGSGGGGGCGGTSFGIYTSGVGTPSYCQAAAMNVFAGGAGGGGGPGGFSTINPGGAGAPGGVVDCSFN